MANKYNGWTNYETWNVALWMGNDQGNYNWSCGQAQESYDQASAGRTFTREEQATLDLAETLKSDYEDGMAEILEDAQKTASVWADLLGSALSEVNWYEIAEHLLEGVDKEEAEASAESEPCN